MSRKSISAHLHVLQKDPASPLVLQTHQLLRMLALLFGLGVKELHKMWKGFIIPIKIVRLKTNKHKEEKTFFFFFFGLERHKQHLSHEHRAEKVHLFSYHREVNIRGIELQVYLSVNGGLAVLVEVLSDL